MGSGAKAPEVQRVARRGARHFARAFFLLPFSVSVLGAAGCPAREVGIMLSDDGAGWLTKACAVSATDECLISERAPPDLQGSPFEAQLFLVTPGDGIVRDSSKCMTISPCFDPRFHNSCVADALNQQLDGAIPTGLGFDGLRDPNQVQLILAIYQPVDLGAAGEACAQSNLVACAGLAQPLGGGNFDISCASCQGGPNVPGGRDNTPCSSTRGCFLRACAALLGSANAQ
jgi:hypothetical protein